MQGARRRRAAAIAAALAIATGAAGLSACGEEETVAGAPQGVPAAGEFTPPSGTPGVPEGAAYDVDGREWLKLGTREQFDAALDYIEANETGRCEDVVIADVVGYTTESYGFDFPLDIEASEVLGEACDASRQSPSPTGES